MKGSPILAFLLLGASSALATVTLQFSSTSVYATNFGNAAGVGGSTLVWGIIIDTAGDGFDLNFAHYQGGVSLVGGQSLTTYDGQASDDYLFVSSNLMNIITAAQAVNDGSVAGQNRITNATGLPYGTNGIGVGDAFAVVWFDTTTLGTVIHDGDKVGVITNPAFTIPSDSSTINFAITTSAFNGPDPLKPMNFYWNVFPEPSSLMLGMLGAVSLLRRRR